MHYNPLFVPSKITYVLSDAMRAAMGKKWSDDYETRRLRERQAEEYFDRLLRGDFSEGVQA